MYDEDRDALAAEYVLGTLSAEEREQAEALLASDSGFAETVRLWEHRLGELNVMVEAVEPPGDLWERIKNDIDGAERRDQVASEPAEMDEQTLGSAESAATQAPDAAAPEQSFETVPDLLSPRTAHSEEASNIAELTSALLAAESSPELDSPRSFTAASHAPPATEIIALVRNLRRWRGLAIAASAIAALLAVYVVVSARLTHGLVPLGRQSQPALAASGNPAAAQLVAVLQQEPTAPAFLVMLDPQGRTITVRRLTAAPDNGRSYELWLNSTKLPKPASLGLVGDEFTNRPIPANLDVETMRGASYSVSLEPAGGSPNGAPTGPILFRGRMVDALPGLSG
jgi:anti-sigma-K factor RskA